MSCSTRRKREKKRKEKKRRKNRTGEHEVNARGVQHLQSLIAEKGYCRLKNVGSYQMEPVRSLVLTGPPYPDQPNLTAAGAN